MSKRTKNELYPTITPMRALNLLNQLPDDMGTGTANIDSVSVGEA